MTNQSSVTMEAAYNQNGFIPTVCGHDEDYGDLVLATIDERPETNLIQVEGQLVRAADVDLTEEQQEQLARYERNMGKTWQANMEE